jgi:hypothetical protein
MRSCCTVLGTVPKEGWPDFSYREKTMQLEDTLVGSRVRVQLDYRKPHRQGAVGTIKKRYGIPEYTAFEVLFADGRRELFWDHQLEEAKESLAKRWWVFW